MKTQVYLDCRRLINKIAFKFHQKSGMEYKELQSEANLIFCEIYDKFDPSKASFITYLHNYLFYRLTKYTKKNTKSLNHSSYEDITEARKKPEQIEFFKIISREATETINTVLNAPEELLELCPKKITKYGIRKYFQSKEWTHRKIDLAFFEIKRNLYENS